MKLENSCIFIFIYWNTKQSEAGELTKHPNGMVATKLKILIFIFNTLSSLIVNKIIVVLSDVSKNSS